MSLLEGHVVLVTGGGSGLGLGVARHCKNEGAELAILEYDSTKVAALKQVFGDEALVIEGDVRDIADLRRCRSVVEERYGRLTSIIGAHGIFDGNVPIADIEPEQLDALFDEIFSINVKGYALVARVFLDMLVAERGTIVLTTSTAAFAADGGGAVYTASKGAVSSLVRQMAYEFAPHVRVNAVAPCGIDGSQMRGPQALGLANAKQSDLPEGALKRTFESIAPLQHLPTGEEYGPFYVALASRENKVVTGQTLIADSGILNRSLIGIAPDSVGIGDAP